MTQLPSKQDIYKIFNDISKRYDIINKVLSFGLDPMWRKSMNHFIQKKHNLQLIDLATGTGDQLFSIMNYASSYITRALGIDLADNMLSIAREKATKTPYKDKVTFDIADAMHLPFEKSSFDIATMSFGIRNVPSAEKTLNEIYRVLKPTGQALILEFSLPQHALLKKCHLFYITYILPLIGQFLSKHKTAYRYLNKTIETFPYGEDFCNLMREAGFSDVQAHPMTCGAVCLYTGKKN